MTDETAAEERDFDEAQAYGIRFMSDPLIADAILRLPAQDEAQAVEDLIESVSRGDTTQQADALARIRAARYFREYAIEMEARLHDAALTRAQEDY